MMRVPFMAMGKLRAGDCHWGRFEEKLFASPQGQLYAEGHTHTPRRPWGSRPGVEPESLTMGRHPRSALGSQDVCGLRPPRRLP